MAEVTVALVFGGRSSEHSISCATAGGILAAIDRDRYRVIPVGITREGAVVLERDDPGAFALDRAAEVVDNGTRILWPRMAGEHSLTLTRPGQSVSTSLDVDVVFPLLHGRWGEDGTIQGLLDLVDMPYVGSGVLASALGMDKHYTKTVLQAAGVPVVPWIRVPRRAWQADPAAVRRRILETGLPAFVKPARGGSSVGVTRVTSTDGLDAALEAGFAEDDTVLVEEAVHGRELEIGVLGGRHGEPTRAAVPGEILVDQGFYDYEAKYSDVSGVRLECPARLDDGQVERMRSLAVRAFDALGCAGLARVDFFLADGEFLVNEINTMPGFTPISMFPTSWKAAGMAYPQLIDELIELALE